MTGQAGSAFSPRQSRESHGLSWPLIRPRAPSDVFVGVCREISSLLKVFPCVSFLVSSVVCPPLSFAHLDICLPAVLHRGRTSPTLNLIHTPPYRQRSSVPQER